MARILCPSVVGRDCELGLLDRALDQARRGRSSLHVVRGPAGVGKSRLLVEARELAERRGATVVAGRCVPSSIAVPYRPLAEALLAAGAVRWGSLPRRGEGFGAALGWIVPEWREAGAVAPPESPVVVAEGFLRALAAMATGCGCMLLVEDLQWADPETLHAIEYLADHIGSTRALVVCSLRAEAGEAATVVGRLCARRAAEVIELRPLSREEVAEMAIRSLEASAIPVDLIDLLEERAEGLPFLVEELLATAATSGALVRDADRWRLSGPIRSLIPESFAVTVRERLHGLGPEGRRLLGSAALLGRSFDWRVAAGAASVAATAAAAVLEQAIAFQLIAAQGETFAFRHALTREATLAQLLPHERSELAARCRAVVEEGRHLIPEWRHVAADLAEIAGDPEGAARLLLDAGRSALGRSALKTASLALGRALDLTRSEGLRAETLEVLAETTVEAGDLRRTEKVGAALRETLAAIGASAERQGSAHLLVARCAVTATHFGLAREELARARRFADESGDRGLLARITAVAAQLAVGEGRSEDAERLAGEAAIDAEATGQPHVVCEALEVASRCARVRDLDEAKEIGERALVVAERAGLAYWRMRALYQVGVVELFRDYSLEGLERARAEAERLGAVATVASLDLEITAGLEAQFRLDEARATGERCIEVAVVLELRGLEAVAHLFRAVIESRRPSRGPMEEAIGRALGIGDDVELRGAMWGDARAIASLAAEQRSRAYHELEEAATVYRTAPPSVLPRLALALLAVLDAVEGRQPDLAAASGATRCNAQGAGYLAYAEAALLGKRGVGATAMEAFQRGEHRLRLSPWYRNLMRRLVAEAAVRDGWGEPAIWLHEAAGFFDEAGSPRLASACRSLLLRAGVAMPRQTRAARRLAPPLREAGVTPREAEVLALVGDGLSNREIAARLSLSVRTVEQHIGSLKRKLGLRTRSQLAVHAAVLEGRA